MRTHFFITITAIALTSALVAAPLPRTADGKPNFSGIWQASGTTAADLQAGRSVVPYQPWAAAKKAENFQNRAKEDPLGKCYMPGVPRIMYLDFPFQIFQTPKL